MGVARGPERMTGNRRPETVSFPRARAPTPQTYLTSWSGFDFFGISGTRHPMSLIDAILTAVGENVQFPLGSWVIDGSQLAQSKTSQDGVR